MHLRRSPCSPALFLVLLPALWGELSCSSGQPGSTGAPAHSDASAARDQASSAPTDGGFAAAHREIVRREYQASANNNGLQAPNRAHNLRTYFASTGIRVHDRTQAGSPELLSLDLAGVGRGETLTRVEAGEVTSDGARVEIKRPGLVEWYENSPAGLEQGITLTQRPSGKGPLVVELSVRGAQASLADDKGHQQKSEAPGEIDQGAVQNLFGRQITVVSRYIEMRLFVGSRLRFIGIGAGFDLERSRCKEKPG